MKFHNLILLTFAIFLAQEVYSQAISVDKEQLIKTTKEALAAKVTGELTSSISESIQKGEAWVADKTYMSIILEDFEVFGINSKDPNFINQIYAIQKEINEKIKNDPSLKSGDLLKGEVSKLVKSGLINYASSYIDKGSLDIISSGGKMISSGKKRISDLLKATETISDLDPYDPNYQSLITTTLKKYGIKSDYFYAINDLDQVMSKGVKYVTGSIEAIGIISEAMGSEDPTKKIELLIKLGKEFGGYTPIIGDLITPIFQLAEGVFNAAKGLEDVLEKNLGQGCITNDGGYGYINPGKKKSFTSKFSNVGRICPLNQKTFSPIYNNIYFEEGNEQQIFFYLNKKWFRGKLDAFHNGGSDIKATIQWLRRNNYSDKVNDLNFVFNAYQKEYGWLSYEKQVSTRIEKIISLFLTSYQTIGFCDEDFTRDFYMAQIGFNWLTKLMQPTDDIFEWNELRNISLSWKKPLVNRMIFNYFLSRNRHNLNNLDRIITSLETYVPIHIYGKITDEYGVPLSGALLLANNAIFQTGSKCHKTITDSNGSFSYYFIFTAKNKANTSVTMSVAADSKRDDRRVVSQDITITPSLSRSYLVNLLSPANKDSTATPVTSNGSSYSDNDIATMLSNAPCADDPNAIAEWDEDSQSVKCSCINNYVWDPAQNKCIQDIQTILDNSDCSSFANTEAKWDYDTNEPYCDCIDGYVWDEDNYENGCISKEQQLLANTDCSQYGNAHAVIDPVTNTVTCDCLPGYVWNDDGTRCISENLVAMQNMDCSQIPNTEPAWDDVSKEPYCDCKPGYEWNDDYTACEKIISQNPNDYACSIPNTVPVWDNVLQQMVCDCKAGYMWNQSQTACIPIKRKPSVDWNNVLNVTMGVLNAMNNNNNFIPPGGNTTGNTGGNNQQPVVSQNNCNDNVKHGGDAPEVHIVDLGQSFGSFMLSYEMHGIKDRIIVSQGGRVLYDSGCVSGGNSVRINLNGFSRDIQVRVNPNCDGTTGTAWDFTVHCPDQ